MNSNPVVLGFPIMKAKTGSGSTGSSGDDSGFDRLIKAARNDSGEGKGDPRLSDVEAGGSNDAEHQLPDPFRSDNTNMPVKRVLNPFAESRVQLAHQNRLEKAQGQEFGDDGVLQGELGGNSKTGEIVSRETRRVSIENGDVDLPSRLDASASGLNAVNADAVLKQDRSRGEATARGNHDNRAVGLLNRSDSHGATMPGTLEAGAPSLKDQLAAEPTIKEVGTTAFLSGDAAEVANANMAGSRSPGIDQQTLLASQRAGDLPAGNVGQAISSLARTEMSANSLPQKVKVDIETSAGKLKASASSATGMEVLSSVATEGRDGGSRAPEITGPVNIATRDASRGTTADEGPRAMATTADVAKSGANAASGVVPVPDPGAATQSQATMSLLRMIEANTNWTTPVRSPAAIANAVQGQDGKVLQSIRIHLHPVELGAVDATLKISGDKISLALKVDRESTQLSLMRDSQAIQNALRMSGYQVDEVIISGTNQDQGPEIGDQALQNGGAEPGEAGDHLRDERVSVHDEEIGSENVQGEDGQATAADGVYI